MTSRSYLVLDTHQQLSLRPHPDNFTINHDSDYSIDRAHELTTWVYKKPFNRSYKLVLIETAENLSFEAQNALLKTLEEPPAHNMIFLTTRNAQNILPTVQSRCTPITLTQFLHPNLPDFPHPPNDPDWQSNFVTTEKNETTPTFPQITTAADAFVQAEKLAQMTRPDLQDYLDDWLTYLTETNPERNYPLAQLVLETKETLTHNTNLQLTLEVLFLEMVTTHSPDTTPYLSS